MNTRPAFLTCRTTSSKKLPGHFVLQEAITVRGERRRVPTRVVEIQVEKNRNSRLVIKPLAELALGLH